MSGGYLSGIWGSKENTGEMDNIQQEKYTSSVFDAYYFCCRGQKRTFEAWNNRCISSYGIWAFGKHCFAGYSGRNYEEIEMAVFLDSAGLFI